MNTIFMKITGYDETTNSLLVSFASDKTKSQNPEDYPSFAFQPSTMWPDVKDPTDIPKLIAVSGMWQTQSQENKETYLNDPAIAEAYKSLVGQTMCYNVSDLIPATTTTNITTA